MKQTYLEVWSPDGNLYKKVLVALGHQFHHRTAIVDTLGPPSTWSPKDTFNSKSFSSPAIYNVSFRYYFVAEEA